MPITSQATRRLIENIQQARQAPQVNRTNYATTPSAIGGTTNPQDVQKFEAEVNSPDYPEELKRLYQTAKATNNYNDFNQAVGRYNLQSATAQTQAQASISAFQKTVDSPDYPAELRSAFYRAKDAGDFSSFNTAIEDYNARNKAEYDKWTAEQAKIKEVYTSARENYDAYIKAHPELLQGGPSFTDNQISDLERGLQYLPPDQRDAVQKVIDDAKRHNSGNVQVGGGEYISKFDYEKIAQSDEQNGTRYLEILKDSGVTGLNAVYQDKANQRNADFNAWLNDNIKSDTYLNDIYLQHGEQAAIAAYDKRYKDLQGIYDRWIDTNIKSDKYLKQVLETKGEKAAIEALDKRYKDINDIYTQAGIQYFRDVAELQSYLDSGDAPEELTNAYYGTLKHFGVDKAVDAYNSALDEYNKRNEKNMAELKAGGYINENGVIDVYSYLQDAGAVAHGLSSNVARARLINRLRAEEKETSVVEFNKMLDAETAKVEAEYNAGTLKHRVQVLRDLGIDPEAIKEAEYNAKLSGTKRIWQSMTPWNEYKGEKASVGGVSHMAADYLLPGYMVATHWKELSPTARGTYLALDILSILLPAAKVLEAGGAAARTVGVSSRTARLLAAFKAGGSVALHEAMGPVNIVIHPISSAKVTQKWIRSVKELLTDPRRTTEAVITNSSGQVMLRASEMRTPAEAAMAVDKIMAKVKTGEKLYVDVGDARIELHQGALMKDTGGYVHATTDLTPHEKNLVVEMADGKPVKEQGLFIASEPPTNYAFRSASGGGAIPLSTEVSGKAEKIWYYTPEDIARMDAEPIREVTIAHAKSIPKGAVPIIERIAKKYKAKLAGSLNSYIKVPGAPKPNDIDLIFDTVPNARAATAETVEALEKAGFKTKMHDTKRIIFIQDAKGNWKEAVDFWTAEPYNKTISPFEAQPTKDINGFHVQTLGENYIHQAFASVTPTDKTAKRVKSINKLSKEMETLLKTDGAVVRRPGIKIFNSATANEAVSTDKLFYAHTPTDWGLTKEVESKFPAGAKTGESEAIKGLWFRYGPRGLRFEVDLEKPLTRSQLLKMKLKALSGIEDLKAPFKPPITVTREKGALLAETGVKSKGIASTADESSVKSLVRELRRGGNITQEQGNNILSSLRIVNAAQAVRQDVKSGKITFIDRPSNIRGNDGQRIIVAPKKVLRGRIVPMNERVDTAREPKRSKEDISRFVGREPVRSAPSRAEVNEGRISPTEARVGQEFSRAPIELPPRSFGAEMPRNPPVERIPGRMPDRIPPRTPPRGTDRIPPPDRIEPPRPPGPPRPPRPPQTPYIHLGSHTDKAKREAILNAGGAIALNMGEVGSKGNRKRVWPTVKNDYNSDDDALVVVGEPPQGATIIQRGKGSAKATAQLIRGKMPQKAVTADYGMMDIKLIPGKGRRLTAHFTPDPMQRTTSDINFFPNRNDDDEKLRRDLDNYGKPPRDLRITPKDLRISPREMRITPKEKPITPREKHLR